MFDVSFSVNCKIIHDDQFYNLMYKIFYVKPIDINIKQHCKMSIPGDQESFNNVCQRTTRYILSIYFEMQSL